MDITMFTQPKDLTEDQKEEYSRKLSILFNDPEGSIEDIFVSLHAFFVSKRFDPKVIATYFDSYWKWYVSISWKTVLWHDKEEFIDIFTYQLPTAFMLDIPVEEHLLNYLHRHSISLSDLHTYFNKLKEALEKRPVLLNPTIQNSPTVWQVAKKYTGNKNSTNIERADLYANIEGWLYHKEQELAFVEEKKQTQNVIAFLELLLFFHDGGNIEAVIDDYLETLQSPFELKQIDEEVIFGDPKLPWLDDDDSNNENDVGDVVEKATPVLADVKKEVKSIQQAPSMKEIRASIEEQFFKTKQPGINMLEEVLSHLDELAEQYNSDAIRDLYYFDEEIGGFVWNQELLR
jgi:hypothetical protein